MLLKIWLPGFSSAYFTGLSVYLSAVGGREGPLLLYACDSNKDVRDPAAEMTFVLPSCGSIPTSSQRETAGESDICIECMYQ